MKQKHPKTTLLLGIFALVAVCLWCNHERILYCLLDYKAIGKWQPKIALRICSYLKSKKAGVELAINDLRLIPFVAGGYTERILLESDLDCVDERLNAIIRDAKTEASRHELARANIIMARRTHQREYVVNLYHCVKEPYDGVGLIRGDRGELCRLIRMNENDDLFKKLFLKESNETLEDVEDNEIITIWEAD